LISWMSSSLWLYLCSKASFTENLPWSSQLVGSLPFLSTTTSHYFHSIY
jgi:hypothetical protein